jgi:hypothetical protein
MCIPCWPFTDVYLEEPPKQKDKGVLVWDPVSKTMVRLTGVISVSACFLVLVYIMFLFFVAVWSGRVQLQRLPVLVIFTFYPMPSHRKLPSSFSNLTFNTINSEHLRNQHFGSLPCLSARQSSQIQCRHSHGPRTELPTSSRQHNYWPTYPHLHPTV